MKRAISFSILAVFLLISVFPAAASQLTDAKDKKSTIDKKIKSVAEEKKEVQKTIKDKNQEKQSLENIKAQEETRHKLTQKELKQLNEEINKLNNSIKASEDDYNKKKELLKKRLKVMYHNADKSFFEILIESKNITDFFERIEVMSIISKRDKELIDSICAAKTDLEYKKSLKIDVKEDKQQKATNLKQEIVQLADKVSRAEDEIAQNQKKLKQLEAEEDALLKESDNLIKLIANLSRKGTKYAGGSMLWPTRGYSTISSYYGMRIHPIFKKKKMHTGIDISAPSGASITASNKGTVIVADWQSGYGNTVVIDHGGGITTLYAHCSRLLVSVGTKVKAGQLIAKVGSTGYSTGPHLHFEVRKNGSTTNPLQYVSP